MNIRSFVIFTWCASHVVAQIRLLQPVVVDSGGISYGSHNYSLDGRHSNRVTCAHSRGTCYETFDLGSVVPLTIFQHFSCRSPGFTNGAVWKFDVSVANSTGGPFVKLLNDSVDEPDGGPGWGVAESWHIPEAEQVDARYVKFNVIENHGNPAYIWFCDVRFYGGRPTTTPTPTTVLTTTLADEIEVVGDDQGHISIAYNKRAKKSSSSVPESEAGNAVDGLIPRVLGSVAGCTQTGVEDMPWWQVDLGQTYAIANITVIGRTNITDQADNLKILVSDTPDFQSGTSYACGGDTALWHTNGRGGQVFTSHHTNSTIVVPCHLSGRYITIQAQENASALVLCEVMVTQVPQEPTCAGCGWRLKACDAADVSSWSIDYIHFVGTDDNGLAMASGTRQQEDMKEYRGPEYPFAIGRALNTTGAAGHGDGWDGLVNKQTGDWYIGMTWPVPQNVSAVYYMTGDCNASGVSPDDVSGPPGFNTCVEMQRWDGSVWLTENWHDDLDVCTWYTLAPEGRALECACDVALLANGVCDIGCNTSACGYDRGACPPTLAPTYVPTQSPTTMPSEVPTVSPTFAPTRQPSPSVGAAASSESSKGSGFTSTGSLIAVIICFVIVLAVAIASYVFLTKKGYINGPKRTPANGGTFENPMYDTTSPDDQDVEDYRNPVELLSPANGVSSTERYAYSSLDGTQAVYADAQDMKFTGNVAYDTLPPGVNLENPYLPPSEISGTGYDPSSVSDEGEYGVVVTAGYLDVGGSDDQC